MYQDTTGRLLNPSESCQVLKVASLLTEALSGTQTAEHDFDDPFELSCAQVLVHGQVDDTLSERRRPGKVRHRHERVSTCPEVRRNNAVSPQPLEQLLLWVGLNRKCERRCSFR